MHENQCIKFVESQQKKNQNKVADVVLAFPSSVKSRICSKYDAKDFKKFI